MFTQRTKKYYRWMVFVAILMTVVVFSACQPVALPAPTPEPPTAMAAPPQPQHLFRPNLQPFQQRSKTEQLKRQLPKYSLVMLMPTVRAFTRR